MIIVGDSDSDEYIDGSYTDVCGHLKSSNCPSSYLVSTDIEPSESPTKARSSRDGPIPLSTDSSQSSMNSLLSDSSVSSSQSSVESMSTQQMYPKPSKSPESQAVQPSVRLATAHVPTFVADIFSSGSSPNITRRKTQKNEDPQPVNLNSEPVLAAKPIPKISVEFCYKLVWD